MRPTLHRGTIPLLAVAALLVATAATAGIQFGRGNIVHVDWGQMEVDLKDPQGRVVTWKVAPGATVKFTDGAQVYRRPKLQDLRPPMYVHFTFEGDPGVIQGFDVKELGFDPAREVKKQAPVQRTFEARVTAVDARRGEIELEVGRNRQAYRVEEASLLRRIEAGDRVRVTAERRDDNEVITELKSLGGGSEEQRGSGRIVRIDDDEVSIATDSRRELYRVENVRILRGVREGDRVRFTYVERSDGTRVITSID